MTLKHKKKLPCAKPSRSQAGNSPQQSCLPFALPPSFPCLQASPDKEKYGGVNFTGDFSWSDFYKRFLHLNRHKIRIQFSRTTINRQPSLLICIFCPCLIPCIPGSGSWFSTPASSFQPFPIFFPQFPYTTHQITFPTLFILKWREVSVYRRRSLR